MMTSGTAAMLTRYDAWADRVLFDAMARLPEGEIHRPTRTLFGSMMGTLNHNYQVGLIWQAHLQGTEHGFTSRRDMLHADFAGLVEAQARLDRWFIEWAGTQDESSLGEVIDFRFVSGSEAKMARGAILLHVVNHKTFHRGWVSEMFFASGARPPQTDLSVYLCEASGD